MRTSTRIVRNFKLPSGAPLNAEDFRAIGDIVRIDIQQGIEEQTQVTGGAYPKLRPNTIAAKTEKGLKSPNKRLIASGNLHRNQKITMITNGVEISIGPTRATVGSYMQHGTKPHTIKPRKKQWLSFVTTEGRQFRKQVRHPGTPPVAFFGISARASRRILEFIDQRILRYMRTGT